MVEFDRKLFRAVMFGALLALGALLIGLLVPWWVRGGVSYIALVLVAFWAPRARITVATASTATAVIVIGDFFPAKTQTPMSMVIIHCTLWVAAIWATTSLVLLRKRAEEERLRFFDLSADLLCAAGFDGYLKRVNPAFERTLGYHTRELLARPFIEFFHPEERRRVTEEVEKLSHGTPATQFEVRQPCKDGSYRWISWSAVPLPDKQLFYAVGRDMTEQRQAAEALRSSDADLRRSQKALQALTAKLISAEEEQRKRLARELHDDLNQRVTIMAINAAKLERELPLSPDLIRGRLKDLHEQLGTLSDDIRLISHQLHPATLDHLGLRAAVEAECQAFSRLEGIPIDCWSENLPVIPDDVALCVYRILQEGLKNIAKHARATKATVKLEGTESEVVLTIEDTGVGFDPTSVAAKAGLGLVSMEERVRLVGGKLAVSAEVGRGTRIVARLPLPGRVQ